MTRIGIALLLFLFIPSGVCAQFMPPQMTFCETFHPFMNKERDKIFADFSNLYNQDNAKNFGIALLGAGILANTEMDHNFQRWHNKHIKSEFSDDFSGFSKFFGEGIIFVPIVVTTAYVSRFWCERRGKEDGILGQFAQRTARGYLAGTPTLLAFQSILGAGRPSGEQSYWRPFRDANGVAGHGYIGAVPFITAAQMTDRPLVKGLFYTMSAFPSWSRVNDDAHYLSQSLLGWYLAYLSVRAVTATEDRRPLPKGLTIFPVSENNAAGLGVFYQF